MLAKFSTWGTNEIAVGSVTQNEIAQFATTGGGKVVREDRLDPRAGTRCVAHCARQHEVLLTSSCPHPSGHIAAWRAAITRPLATAGRADSARTS